ncbi:MAG: response regulator [Rudaea sp.]
MDNHPALLVVDDDQSILDLVNDALKGDYEVRTAGDVLEAADLFRENHFDLLILDLNMPVVDGEELMQLFAVDPGFGAVPILIISAYPDLIERVKKARVQAILPKPFSIANLRRVVAETIAQSKTAQASPPPGA